MYLDTSLVVAALTEEAAAPAARRAIAENRTDPPLISDWVVAEFSSAIGLKVRSKKLSEVDGERSVRFFEELAATDLRTIQVRRRDFIRAAQLCEAFQTGLRAPDALHLAVAEAATATLLTLDAGMARAGAVLGLDTRLLA